MKLERVVHDHHCVVNILGMRFLAPGHGTDAAREQKIEWLSCHQHSLLPERFLTPKKTEKQL